MRFVPPGLLRPDAEPDVLMMICTSGHVDHGKTQLVKLLTGCNTSRLKEEIERGMTIDLGFAPCLLGGDHCVGIVDVPGHERFVRNMVAGVSGIDMTILVVAADDGVMPQTFEHMQIMKLLGVRKGMVALTKIDLVEPAIVEQRRGEIRAFLEGSFMADAPICAVSSVTFQGYEEFYSTLVAQIEVLKKQPRAGVFRMPVERSFKHTGFGCVVTGIPVAGQVRVGDQLELVPGGATGRVRGLQCFLRDKPVGSYGQCLALNVPDFSRHEVERGQVLCAPGYLQPARFFHVRVTVLPGVNPPLGNAEEIKFHTGTVEEHGKLFLLEGGDLPGGGSGLATIVLERAVVAALDDRYVVRRPSPAATVGGGEILAISPEAVRPMKRVALSLAREYEEAMAGVDKLSPEGIDRRIEYELRHAGSQSATCEAISRRALLPVELVAGRMAGFAAAGVAVAVPPERYLHREVHAECLRAATARIEQAVAKERTLSLSAARLREELGWPPPVWTRIQADLQKTGVVAVQGDKVLPAAADKALTEAERTTAGRLLELYERTGFLSPHPMELPALLGAPETLVRRMMDYLCNRGQLVRLSPAVALCYKAWREAQDKVVKIIQEEGALDSADFRTRIGTSRKYAIAILDYLDQRHVTIRTGNLRKLTSDYLNHLL